MKQKHGEHKWKELLREGNLTYEMAKRKAFYEHMKRVKKCVKHGSRTAEAQEICFLCQAIEAFKTGQVEDPGNFKDSDNSNLGDECIDTRSDLDHHHETSLTNQERTFDSTEANEKSSIKGPFVPKSSKNESIEE